MNLELSHSQPEEQASFAATPRPAVIPPSPGIERCEFEALLLRAMEILSARAKTAPASNS